MTVYRLEALRAFAGPHLFPRVFDDVDTACAYAEMSLDALADHAGWKLRGYRVRDAATGRTVTSVDWHDPDYDPDPFAPPAPDTATGGPAGDPPGGSPGQARGKVLLPQKRPNPRACPVAGHDPPSPSRHLPRFAVGHGRLPVRVGLDEPPLPGRSAPRLRGPRVAGRHRPQPAVLGRRRRPPETMMDVYRVRQLAAADDLAPLVLELLEKLCRQDGVAHMHVVSPTAPPPLSTPVSPAQPEPVDKSGVPTTTTNRDIESEQ